MKSDKKTANYRKGTSVRYCKICTMFRPPNVCTAVKGDIKPDGLCDYFKRAARPKP